MQQALDKALSRVAMLAMGGMGVASVANLCIYDVDGVPSLGKARMAEIMAKSRRS